MVHSPAYAEVRRSLLCIFGGLLFCEVVNFGRKDGTEFVLRALPIGGYVPGLNPWPACNTHREHGSRGLRQYTFVRALFPKTSHVLFWSSQAASVPLQKESIHVLSLSQT